MEVNVIKLENNLEYIIIDAIEDNNNKYLVMTREDDPLDICVRKIITLDNEEYLDKLETEEEFEKIIKIFNDRHKEEEGK